MQMTTRKNSAPNFGSLLGHSGERDCVVMQIDRHSGRTMPGIARSGIHKNHVILENPCMKLHRLQGIGPFRIPALQREKNQPGSRLALRSAPLGRDDALGRRSTRVYDHAPSFPGLTGESSHVNRFWTPAGGYPAPDAGRGDGVWKDR